MMMSSIRWAVIAPALAAALAMASCGGGGGSASSGGHSSGSAPCTGSTAGGASPAANMVPLVVDGACGGVNQAYVTITVCVPNTGSCQRIDHVWVDTGSVGLRLLSSALTLPLPATTQNGNTLANCVQFISTYSWGSVRLADVRIAGESASSVPVQVIGDGAVPAAPSSCVSGTAQLTPSDFQANGILGIGLTLQDCGLACTPPGPAPSGAYYTCPGNVCAPAPVPLNQQLQNVVSYFAVDNTGVQMQLPAIASASGQASATGWLIFGIGTQANNGLGAATVFPVDLNPADANLNPPTYLDINTIYAGVSLPASYIDSGSNAWYFDEPNIGQCGKNQPTGFYCQTTGTLHATMQGFGGSPSFTYSFSVADASSLLNSANAAFNNLAGPAGPPPGTFDWGLPFIYGRSVYTAIEGQNAGGITGPYFAATP